jgi:diketogulonate reductase-like aldo/keto reductase
MTLSTPDVPLHDGTTIPQFGLGVFQMTEAEAEAAVGVAIRAGYRLVDTAAGYENETAVGRALASLGRRDVYVTTKLANDDHGHDSALAAFDASIGRLGLETLDLYLIHWPSPRREKYVETWRALIRLREEGRVRSIGVSNFEPHHLRRLVDETGVVPVVNQVELHPFHQQRELRETHRELGIITEAWSPLGQGKTEVLADPEVVRIAKEHDATPAQVVLAWHLAIGNVVIPKSVTPSRIEENLGAVQLELTHQDLAAFTGLDRGLRVGPHPDSFD